MPQYLNLYECQTCSVQWDDQWSCGCDDECPKCGTAISPFDSSILGLEGLTAFEIEGAGFDGSGDSDDRIVWVAATTQLQVATAIEGLGAKLCTMDSMPATDADDSIDFVLPGDLTELQEKLLGFQTKTTASVA